MPASDLTALAKVEDAIKAQAETFPALEGQHIFTDRSAEDALEDAELPGMVIYTTNYAFSPSEDQGMDRHDAQFMVDFVRRNDVAGVVSRAAQATVADFIAALHVDRTLGGRIGDIEPVDVAPPFSGVKDVTGVTLELSAYFYTPRGDHFTLVGLGGDTF